MILLLSSITVFSIITSGFVSGESEISFQKNSRDIFKNGPCWHDQFHCSNDECVSKSQFCNGYNDCGDNSDEEHCSKNSCPPLKMTCKDSYYYKCIPLSWICDGEQDCVSGNDENACELDENSLNLARIVNARDEAIRWTLRSRYFPSLKKKWGLQVARKAVAWYLGDQDSFLRNKTFVNEMVYEISLNLLSRIASRRLKDVSSLELASYINAFLVTCIDPRRFYDMDLVRELRQRTDASNTTHPSVMLALCNAGERIGDSDVTKTIEAFWIAHENYRTDVEALAVLALSCAVNQDQQVLGDVDIGELTIELKKKQYQNGSLETLKTTALVMQALYASESESDEDNFDEDKALKQILNAQHWGGSFGNTANTYYVLPVLSYRSLVDVSSSHCTPPLKDEKDSLQDLLNLVGQKSSVRYSLWIGNRSLERTITLKVPSNTSFYGIMEWAARVDSQFSFEYSMRDKKPYIYSIWNIQDDPENGQFWFLHTTDPATVEKKLVPVQQSPADVFPKNGQHLVYWYKSG